MTELLPEKTLFKPKIIHLTSVHPPFDTRIFHKECKTLARAGYDVTLIAQHTRHEVIDGIKIIPLPKPNNRLQRIFSITWKAFKLSRNENAAIYHFHDPELIPIGILLKIFTKGKVIYDVHEDIPAQILTKNWIPAHLRRLIAIIFSLIEKIIVKKNDAIVATTEGIADNYKSIHPVVIHNYPDLAMLPAPSTNIRDKNKNGIIYVGGISKIRGAVEMIKALEKTNESLDAHLHLIGNFDSIDLEHTLQTLEGYKYVVYSQSLPWAEAWKKAEGMKAGLVLYHPVPNHIKTLPNKIFEYMMIGLPVIAASNPLLKDIIEKEQCGLVVDPLDVTAISRAIEFILTHPENARIMGENGHRAIINNYNWEKEGEKLLSLYQQILM